jgi:hypothetical protein
MQAITSAPALGPDHPAMIGAHRAGEATVPERREHAAHVHIAEPRGMRDLVKAPLACTANIPAMREVDPAARRELSRHGNDVVIGPAA